MTNSPSRLDALLEWSVVGSFTSIGHKIRSRNWQPLPADALDGKVVVITGATAGIGKKTAIEAARLGANVRFIARNPDKAAGLQTELETISPSGEFGFYLADLGLMSEISKVSDEILSAEPAIDVLINNVGILPTERTETTEGLESAYATDLVGPFLLTNRLRDRMVSSAPSRIINVISGGMYTQPLELDDPNYETGEYRGSVAYARAKRGMMILTKMWADRLAGTGVTVNATHPGWVDTPGVQESLPGFHRIAKPLLRTTEQGVDTILWLAAAEPGGEATGKLWHDRAVRSEYRIKSTIETAAERNRLWDQLSATVEATLAGWHSPTS